MSEGPRFLKMLRGDRRASDRRGDIRDRRSRDGEADRSGDRRQQDRRSNRAGRRRTPRRPVPFGPGSPSGALTNAAGRSLHVKLWDVSEGGLCVLARSPIVDPPGSLLVLELDSGMGIERLRQELQLVWAAAAEGDFGTCAGLQFLEGQTLPNGSFLDHFLSLPVPQ
ncbi:MAG: hypothetical protein ACKO7Z_09470 [Cyanobacteriota bacterium]